MLKKIILIIVALWILLSVARVFLNITKFFLFDLDLVFSQDKTKREKLLPCYRAAEYLNEFIKKKETVYVDYPNGLCFFTLRYYLYPIRVYTSGDKKLNSKNYTYLITTRKNIDYGRKLLKDITIESNTVHIFK